MLIRKTNPKPDICSLKQYLEYAVNDAKVLDPTLSTLLESAILRLRRLKEEEKENKRRSLN